MITILCAVGCVSKPPPADELIVGTWQSSLSGFSLSSVYTADSVSVDGHAAVPYSLAGNELIVDGDVAAKRIISFPSKDEMIQRDPVADVEHRYTRNP